MVSNQHITIIGGGLAGAEAAWHAARAGVSVRLYEMRPAKQTSVHCTGSLAELVCSNSLKSDLLTSASGLLKEEMRILDSVVVSCGDANRVPAGEALAVDRERFAECVTERVAGLPNVETIREEVTEIPTEGVVIIASGPLTSDALAKSIGELTGLEYLYFYDAVAPTITADSIDHSKVFKASRYDKGEAAYLNCPLTEDEYNAFWEALVSAERVPLSDFEPLKLFEGCMPVEEIASRGKQTLAFGPMKPVGLVDPVTGKRPYAVVQLRQENVEGTLWGLVGFQTRLKWGEQERVFRMIPGLEHAEFARFGVMHRNTYIQSPELLTQTLRLRESSRFKVPGSKFRVQGSRLAGPATLNLEPETLNSATEPLNLEPETLNLFFAGQFTGVEGYVESAAMGIIAGINAARLVKGEEPLVFPVESMIGSLANYISSPQTTDFQPMNANFGILPKLDELIRSKKDRRAAQVERALQAIRRLRAG
jgi:methylenetetrahydrofolate--tRNA-(uracil-5-)-methyltransferase